VIIGRAGLFYEQRWQGKYEALFIDNDEGDSEAFGMAKGDLFLTTERE
jgi:hypothetical protein